LYVVTFAVLHWLWQLGLEDHSSSLALGPKKVVGTLSQRTSLSWAWWYVPVIPVIRKEDGGLKLVPGKNARVRLKNYKSKKG
jgi:hypothetical protein